MFTETVSKSSLRYLNTLKYTIGQPHLVWQDAGFDAMSVHKAGWKVRIMSGTYMLKATRDKFNQHEVDPSCLLCRKEPENTEHFLLRCESLSGIRQLFLDKIIQTLQNYVDVGQLNRIRATDTEFATLILDNADQ